MKVSMDIEVNPLNDKFNHSITFLILEVLWFLNVIALWVSSMNSYYCLFNGFNLRLNILDCPQDEGTFYW